MLLMLIKAIAFAQYATINHTAIFVKNAQRSAIFYKNIIGLDTLTEPFKDGKHFWFKTGANTALHIIEGAKRKRKYYKNQHTCYSVKNLKEFVTLLSKNNISFEDVKGLLYAITTRVDGVQQIWLRDPDGYWIEVNDAT